MLLLDVCLFGTLRKRLRRLAYWKMHYLSKGERLALIKGILSYLPIYFMSIFPLPLSMMLRLETIQLDFLSGGNGGEKNLQSCEVAYYLFEQRVSVMGI